MILKTLSLAPMHGWGIGQRIRQMSSGVLAVNQGSLYPALHRLERRGLLAAEWKPSDTGRDAKFYRLTPRGHAKLQEQTESWARLAEAVGLILGTAGGGAR